MADQNKKKNVYEWKRSDEKTISTSQELDDDGNVRRSVKFVSFNLQTTNTESGEVKVDQKFSLQVSERKWSGEIRSFYDKTTSITLKPQELAVLLKDLTVKKPKTEEESVA